MYISLFPCIINPFSLFLELRAMGVREGVQQVVGGDGQRMLCSRARGKGQSTELFLDLNNKGSITNNLIKWLF